MENNKGVDIIIILIIQDKITLSCVIKIAQDICWHIILIRLALDY